MDLAQLVQQKCGDDTKIDRDQLQRVKHIPHGQLERERELLESKLESSRQSQKALAAAHVSKFVGAKADMDKLDRLVHTLSKSAGDSVEVSLASPRVPVKAYTALHELLANDFVVHSQIDKIHELLLLPELVEDYAASGNYSSALDLASMTERLQIRYPHSQIISDLVNGTKASVNEMQDLFLVSLKEASRLPLLTRAVTFLQRLNYRNLNIVFIDSRWQFLQSQWSRIPAQLQQTQPLAFLKRVIELYREHVFATINGYRTIFQDVEQTPSETSIGEIRLALFSRQALNVLLAYLREHAPLIKDESDRTSLWLQLAFCANSLGRVGNDFWPLLDSSILSEQEWEEASKHQRDMAGRLSRYTK